MTILHLLFVSGQDFKAKAIILDHRTDGVAEGRLIFANLKRSIQYVRSSWIEIHTCIIPLPFHIIDIQYLTAHRKSFLSYYVRGLTGKGSAYLGILDVVVPLPLPLSAILILVIGLSSSLISRSHLYAFGSPDLGFELCTGVRYPFQSRLRNLAEQFTAHICLG